MNIGIVTSWFESGAGYVSRQYASAFKRSGHTVHIFGRRGYFDSTYYSPDVESVTWARPVKYPRGVEFDMRHYCLWMKKNHIHMVLFNEQTWMRPVTVAREYGIRTLGYVDFYTRNNIRDFEVFDTLLCNTRRHYEAFRWHHDVHYVPWGTDVALFVPQPRIRQTQTGIVYFHSCGETPSRKGTDLLIQAFDGIQGNCLLVIHTRVNLLTVFPALAEVITKLQRDGRLTQIVGTAPAPGLYNLGDVYVYPTRLEGIGLTIAEALACGLPVITTDNPPMNEFVNESCGSLVSVDTFVPRSDGYYWDQSIVSVPALREAMLVWADRVKDIEAWSQRARSNAELRMNWANNEEYIQSIINSNTTNDSKTRFSEVPTEYVKESTAHMVMNFLYRLYRRLRNKRLREYLHPKEKLQVIGADVTVIDVKKGKVV